MDRSLGSLDASQKSLNRRKRNRAAPAVRSNMSYRIQFSRQYLGRYIANSKRKLTWRFGFVVNSPDNSKALKDHEIELVWSMKSGKKKLFWNKQDISTHVKKGSRAKASDHVELKWESTDGVTFQVLACASPGVATQQYDLRVNGISFFSFPPKSRFVCASGKNGSHQTKLSSNVNVSKHEQDFNLCAQSDSPVNKSLEAGDEVAEMVSQQQRLAAAGFKSVDYQMSELEDELRSDLYSSKLDILRDAVSSSVPETEEMMSRAIINAFSEEHSSTGSNLSLDSLSEKTTETSIKLDTMEVEVETMRETFHWLKWSRDVIFPADYLDLKLEFMEKHIKALVSHVRHGRLPTKLASHLIVNLAKILGLRVTKAPIKNTIVFFNISSTTTSQDLIDAMTPFGQVAWAQVSTKTRSGFGMCRFASEAAVQRVCAISTETPIKDAGGMIIDAYEMFSSPFSEMPESIVRQVNMAEEIKGYRKYEFNGDDSISEDASSCSDIIRLTETGVEAMYMPRNRKSFAKDQLRPPTFRQNSFNSTTARNLFQRPSFKFASASGTVSTLSTLGSDDPGASTASMPLLD